MLSILVLIIYCLILCAAEVCSEGEYPSTAVARLFRPDFNPFRYYSWGHAAVSPLMYLIRDIECTNRRLGRCHVALAVD